MSLPKVHNPGGMGERPILPTQHEIAEYHAVLPATLELTAKLDGSNGHNRAPNSIFGTQANDDFTLVAQFLMQYRGRVNTYLAYRVEIARLLLWAIVEKQKPVSSLTRDDMWGYACFLVDPPVSWCAERRRLHEHGDSAWQPFMGPPSDKTILRSLNAVSHFFNWGITVLYFQANPVAMYKSTKDLILDARAKVKGTTSDLQKRRAALDTILASNSRHLCAQAMEAVKQALAEFPLTTEQKRLERERAIFIITLLYCTGSRGGVVVTAKMDDIIPLGNDLWLWKVTDKGGKIRCIPLTTEVMRALGRYREAFGLSAATLNGDATPLVFRIDTFLGSQRRAKKLITHKKTPEPLIFWPMTHRRINQVLNEVGERAAEIVLTTDGYNNRMELAKQLRAQSAHWWRHTAGTVLGDKRMRSDDIRDFLGHADSRTIQVYVHKNLDYLRDQLNDMPVFGFDETKSQD